MAASPFTSLIRIPLPTEQVWILLCKCGQCPERGAAELGFTEVSRCSTYCCHTACAEPTQSALAPYPQPEPPIFKDNNPVSLSEGFAPLSSHFNCDTETRFPDSLLCLLCSGYVSYCPENYSLEEHSTPLETVTLKPPFLSAFLQGHNKAGHY